MEEKIFKNTYGGVFSDPHKFGWVTSCWNKLYDKESNVSFSVEVEVAELLYSIIRAVKPLVVVETGHHIGLSQPGLPMDSSKIIFNMRGLLKATERKVWMRLFFKEKMEILSKLEARL